MSHVRVHLEESKPEPQRELLLCPSAQPQLTGSVIFAAVNKSDPSGRVEFLKETVRVSDATLVAFANGTVRPTEVFRFAAPCVRNGCRNWSGHECRVAEQLVQIQPADSAKLPECSLRAKCRWYRQRSASACAMCSVVVT